MRTSFGGLRYKAAKLFRRIDELRPECPFSSIWHSEVEKAMLEDDEVVRCQRLH
jgi:hypothetical protein